MNYFEFLKTKIQTAPISGFDVRPEEVNSVLLPLWKDAVFWACMGGRRAFV